MVRGLSSTHSMQPPLSDDELAALYPHLTVDQRREMEGWHRGRIQQLMVGLPVDENEQPPYPEVGELGFGSAVDDRPISPPSGDQDRPTSAHGPATL